VAGEVVVVGEAVVEEGIGVVLVSDRKRFPVNQKPEKPHMAAVKEAAGVTPGYRNNSLAFVAPAVAAFVAG